MIHVLVFFRCTCVDTRKLDCKFDMDMDNISGKKSSHKHTLAMGNESIENDEPKFGTDWEYFEEKFDVRDTIERFERCSSMFTEGETAGHSPKFGADWEQFSGDIKKTDARQTENTDDKEINETDTVFDSQKFAINEWERLEKVFAKTGTQKEKHSTNDQTKAEEESISNRTNSFEDFSTLRYLFVVV
ncbi:uncharacterized protein LOC128547125 [Mercenaria mercenaria]|uniref:uncharacterized protein LOC128547125 n=1 Tax=Mercenaria mercenaria TaxID=6596 RepID=UPI00234ED549|nr:uncharacterized protein LOC128547125 [Mercenaria mercenaria]